MLTKIENEKINANELKIIQAINGKKFNEISMHMQKILLTMFGNIDSNDEQSTEIVMGFKKPDIQVKYKNVTKYISIKGGNNENVHKEEVKTFVLFLRNLGVSIKTQQTILYYHYSDRTMDGSGKIRYTFSEMMKILGKRIKELRQRKGLTQEQLAEMIDVGERNLSKIECGNNFVTAETLSKIITALEVEPTELFNFKHLDEKEELKKELMEAIRTEKVDIKLMYQFYKSIR